MSRLFFSISGRIDRLTYIVGIVITMISTALTNELLGYVFVASKGNLALLYGVGAVATIINVWLIVAITAKRLHDTNRAAWWIFAAFVPIIGPIFLMVVCVLLTGNDSANSYGPPPSKFLDYISGSSKSSAPKAGKRSPRSSRGNSRAIRPASASNIKHSVWS